MKSAKSYLLASATLLIGSAFAQTPTPPASGAKPMLPHPSPRTIDSPCQPSVNATDVIAQYASLTRLRIIKDNFIQGKVCMDDVSKLPLEKAIEMIERTLFSNGFAITQIDSDTVEVTGSGISPRGNGVPVISDPKSLPNQERLVSVVLVFKYRKALEMQQIFGQYLSPPRTWTRFLAEPNGNTLLVTERTSVIRNLIDIAEKIDIPDRQKEP